MDLKFVSISFGIFILLHSSKTTFSDQFTNQNDLETYIVQLELPEDFVFSDSKDLYLWHQSFLPTTISDHSSRIIYSYRHVLNGFSASPSLLGLHQNVGLWKASNYGKGVIIGLLDSGITPKHPSFNDNGMTPPPAKWKGKSQSNFTACNNKLIGARNFVMDEFQADSPFDRDGFGFGFEFFK
ncbi:Subtilisin-like protease SBT4.14 [Capsicum baccatum]|uniref:Subtilisin-like protease SBT4.14 n=1 Tax=Capsicum baccatum TaxID=33114 RepID=A0A2G2XE58_CAPBA|nr:Subtilisin-like protease SBT4.14 [Capsicum baccatum]